MDLGKTALGNWKAQQGGCTHIQVRTSYVRCSTRCSTTRENPFPPPLCSSSTRSMTSSEFSLYCQLGGPRTFLLTHLFLLYPHPTTTTPLLWIFCFRFQTKKTKYNNKNTPPEKGVRIAGWNSPNTTSDKTFLWRCAVFPHKKNKHILSLVVRYWPRQSVFFLPPLPSSRGFLAHSSTRFQ